MLPWKAYICGNVRVSSVPLLPIFRSLLAFYIYLWMAEIAVKDSLFATGGIKVDELFIIIANDYKVVILLFTFKVISGIKLWQ